MPDPIEAICYTMETRGLSCRDLEPYIGNRAHVFEILRHKRSLSIDMIRRLPTGLARLMLQSNKASLTIAQRLAAKDPQIAEWQKDLAVSYGKSGWFRNSRGKRRRPGRFSRVGRAIMTRLVKLSPTNAPWRRDLEWFEGEIDGLEKGR